MDIDTIILVGILVIVAIVAARRVKLAHVKHEPDEHENGV